MTENNPQEDYAGKVADLVSTAFDTMGEALKQPAGAKRNGLTDKAKLQVAAAQVLSNLNTAREIRIQTFAILAGLDPAAVQQAGELPREAYTAAAWALGLVEDGEDQERIESLRRSLMGENDPADADLGDLK
jgi:hypothetical protein